MAELVTMDLGRIAYAEALELQLRLVERLIALGTEHEYLLLLEHDPPVITLGRGADEGNLLASPQQLSAKGIEVHHASRGGDVTYHGPGQLVAYPIMRLDRRGRDVHKYLRDLEETVIRLLGPLGVEPRREKGLTGVWVRDEKIAAIGVAVRRWVSYHGVALNVSPDLSHFDLIVPCGLAERRVTSLAEILGPGHRTAELKPVMVECFCEVFGFSDVSEGSTHRRISGID
ncbi:MAG: lipoyl(octanoyl) transferase LipB [Planctomycetota bacterium]|nr:lipoyl(octanoyl) transferase LipB [Planctomycetota bacterium]